MVIWITDKIVGCSDAIIWHWIGDRLMSIIWMVPLFECHDSPNLNSFHLGVYQLTSNSHKSVTTSLKVLSWSILHWGHTVIVGIWIPDVSSFQMVEKRSDCQWSSIQIAFHCQTMCLFNMVQILKGKKTDGSQKVRISNGQLKKWCLHIKWSMKTPFGIYIFLYRTTIWVLDGDLSRFWMLPYLDPHCNWFIVRLCHVQ